MRTSAQAVASAALLLLAACGGGSGGSTPAPASKLRISVTDAPFPFGFVESASVVIREVRVHEQGSDAWSTVFSGAAEIDLVPLTGGVTELLVDASVPPGTYDRIRLIVEAGEVVLTPQAHVSGGSRRFSTEGGNLHTPSAAQTGLKILLDDPVVVTTQLSGDLLLDFDLSRCFVFNGPVRHHPGVKRVVFTPVIRARNLSTAGTLALEVASDAGTPDDASDDVLLEGATVRVLDADGHEVAVVPTDAAGYAQTSLPPGTYALKVEADGHASREIADVQVFLANRTDLGVVVLALAGVELAGLVVSDGATPDDPDDDTPLPYAFVEVLAAGTDDVVTSGMADDQGAFVFTDLAAGTYDLSIVGSGHQAVRFDGVATAAPGVGEATVFVLPAMSADLQGTVFDAGYEPVEGASVLLENLNGQAIGSATTDADGAYAIAGVPSGTHRLSSGDASRWITVVGSTPPPTQTEDLVLPE